VVASYNRGEEAASPAFNLLFVGKTTEWEGVLPSRIPLYSRVEMKKLDLKRKLKQLYSSSRRPINHRGPSCQVPDDYRAGGARWRGVSDST